jgi:hypothetical protein
MNTKVLSSVATVALAAGLTVGIAAPASAHTGDMNVQAVCNTATGQYDFTATLTVSRSGDKAGKVAARVGSDKFDGTPKSDKGMGFVTEIAGDGVYSLPGFSLPGATTGAGPWVYAYTTFAAPETKNSFGSDGQLRYKLDGTCAVPKPDPKEPVVKFGEWQEASIVCGATEVATKREVFTTSYIYDEKSNSYVEGETVTTTEDSVRQLTSEEVAANVCPVVEEPETPVEPPVVDVPTDIQLPTVPVSAELARTGSSPLIPAGIASLLLAVGGFLLRRKVRA